MHIFNLKNIIAKHVLKHGGGIQKGGCIDKKNMRQISLINMDLLDLTSDESKNK